MTAVVATTLSERSVKSLTSALANIERKGRTADFERAMWARRVVEEVGLYAQRAMVEQLGLAAGTAGAYMRRLQDLDLVPAKEVWIAVGWTRVRQLAAIEDEARTTLIGQLLAARDGHGVCPDWRAAEILAPYVKRTRRESKDQALVTKALGELRYILENFNLGDYTPPADVAALVGADVVKKPKRRAPPKGRTD